MEKKQKPWKQFHSPYYGRILNNQFSNPLKKHLAEYIRRFEAFDEISSPALPYIAAWQKRKKTIWYEFISKHLIDLIGGDYEEAPEVFRNSIIERHRFIKKVNRRSLMEEILISRQVKGRKEKLRGEVIKRGTLEAVYKIHCKNGATLWFKDQAVLEVFDSDAIYLSLGNLTNITREMELDEQLKDAQVALTKSKQKYRDQAIHDNLTGLYNTRHLYSSLSRLIVKSKKTKEPLSLIFMDIDNFKNVVDKNGHMIASKTLQAIAGTIKRIIKEPSLAVAYGGDEFVLALPDYTKQQALDKAELIRTRIKDSIYLRRIGLEIRVTASFGVSTFPDDSNRLDKILALADRAMFAVKNDRKDSVYSLS